MANTHAEKPTVRFVDELVLQRPKGVYTGDSRRKHKRSKSASDMNSGSVHEYDLRKHRRALSLQPYIRDGKVTADAEVWTPRPASDGNYGSEAMKELSEEFGTLAADLVKGFTEGK